MKRILLFAVVLAVPLAAQEVQQRVQGYGYFGLMGSDNVTFGKTLNPGLGAEIFVYKGLAASFDAGYAGYYNNFRADGFGLFSPDVSYHFKNSTRVEPFLSAGYTLGFRDSTVNMGNYGGGLICWFSKHAGFRMEARDHRDANGQFFTALRFGVSFR